MGISRISRLSTFLLSTFCFFSLLPCLIFASKKSYIVYMGEHSHDLRDISVDFDKVTDSHHEFLGSFLGSKEKAKDAIFYSYTKSINGFAAIFEEEEAKEISKHPNVLSVFLDKENKLHTTRTWDVVGLTRGSRVVKNSLMSKARFGEEVIIANMDSGVWPESESFNDEGMRPIPSRWRGKCQSDSTSNPVKCNRKLIGAKMFYQGFKASSKGPIDSSDLSPRDTDGHGTHTLSTAAGRFVHASIFGQANGTAKGGSPKARVAAYKVCWGGFCSYADILAGVDTAIYDGVDVISMSIGGAPLNYLDDGISIAAFHAVSRGIDVICSAGNAGPSPGSATNLAPWIFTVAASTIDREFDSNVQLGNNKQFQGRSISQKSLPKKLYPLIKAEDAKATNVLEFYARLCFEGTLDTKKAKGKIVVCLHGIGARVDKGAEVLRVGGAGMILANDQSSGNEIIADAHFLPAIHITYTDGEAVYSYINSTKSPVAYITPPKTLLNIKPAPSMASFSSQGPNVLNPEILKPDITAPGVNILAAYSEVASPTGSPSDNRRVPFNLISGTSMSCPHVAGVVGLLRALHPHWSPAAIRSAIMTSAQLRDNEQEPITNSSYAKANPFNYGGGHIRPNGAMNPGLIYDLSTRDHLNFLCNLNYTASDLMVFYNKPYSCPSKTLSLLDFNYPSISVPLLTDPTTLTRRVKNVGAPGTYKVKFTTPPGVSMQVKPKSLTFKKEGEEKVFKVTLVPKGLGSDYEFGSIAWSDGVHHVTSPVAVKGV